MPSCLGLYVEQNIIKYAKLSKDNNGVKIDSFGLKFYDNLAETIKQVISETYSFKTPISINLSEEQYNYLSLFTALSKKDMDNVIKTEFESICADKGINKDAYDTKYVFVNQLEDRERIKVIHVAVPKTDINKKNSLLEDNIISNVSPIPLAIPNLLENAKTENFLIVNIEDKTTITTVANNNVYNITSLDLGMSDILSKINEKENSYSKSYEICKNTTIYTNEGKDLQYEENPYLEDIMPTLYDVVGQVRKIINESLTTISKVYITGTASAINNIDLYFQEYLKDIKCEILKPYFINTNNAKINIKDYIEVNSAIAMALQGLGEGIKNVNFKKANGREKLVKLLKTEINISDKLGLANGDLNVDKLLSKLKKSTQMFNIIMIILIVLYSSISITIGSLINKKEQDVQASISNINTQIETLNNYKTRIEEKSAEYDTIITNIKERTTIAERTKKLKNSIPVLMDELMEVIPTGVQISSIQATSDVHIVINARADNYEQLGFLKVKIAQEDPVTGDPILYNVVSDSGQRVTETINKVDYNFVKVVIEGDLLPE